MYIYMSKYEGAWIYSYEYIRYLKIYHSYTTKNICLAVLKKCVCRLVKAYKHDKMKLL